jgi:hypothetical protein
MIKSGMTKTKSKIWMLMNKIRRDIKKKSPKNNTKCKNEQGERETLQEGCSTMCQPKKRWSTKPFRKNDDLNINNW